MHEAAASASRRCASAAAWASRWWSRRCRSPQLLRITRATLDAIDAHARAETPRECCGLLLGHVDDSAFIIVERAVAAGNIAPEPTRYLIDPADHFRVLREARHTGLTIVGAYHSHPASQPIPSPTDLAEALPNFLYLIVSPLPGGSGSDVRAWCLAGAAPGTDPASPADGNFLEVPIVLLP